MGGVGCGEMGCFGESVFDDVAVLGEGGVGEHDRFGGALHAAVEPGHAIGLWEWVEVGGAANVGGVVAVASGAGLEGVGNVAAFAEFGEYGALLDAAINQVTCQRAGLWIEWGLEKRARAVR